MYSKETLEKIKKTINPLNFFASYTHLTKTGNNYYSGRCPHPDHKDNTPSFRVWIYPTHWSWCCMSCHSGEKNIKYKNYGSDVFAFYQWMSDTKSSKHILSFNEAVKKAAEYANINIDQYSDYSRKYKDNLFKARAFLANHNKKSLYYLLNRGLTKEDISSWMIGFDGERITFPLFDINNNIIGFSNRILEDNKNGSKYINSANSDWFKKREFLYGLNNLLQGDQYVIITEGVMDVIMAQKYGINAICSLGTSFTDEQAAIIKKLKLYPVFAFDGDDPGQKATVKAIEKMSSIGISSFVFSLDNGSDLYDFCLSNKEKSKDILNSKISPYWIMLLQEESAEWDNLKLRYQNNIAKKIGNIANTIKSSDDRRLYKSYIYKKFDLVI